MTDKSVVQQILGGLMQRPQLISEVDKYNLNLTDFSTKFEKIIFLADCIEINRDSEFDWAKETRKIAKST